MTDDYTQSEIVRVLQRLETSQTRMESKVDKLTDGFVTRDIFEIQVAALRQENEVQVLSLQKDMDELKATHQKDVDDLRASRAPWWSVASVVIAICAVVAPFLLR